MHHKGRASADHVRVVANALADRIAVMEGGVLQQYGSPAEIKERPANLFTGTFVGEPPMNVFPVTGSVVGDQLHLDLEGGLDLVYPQSAFAPQVREAIVKRGRVVLGVRPYAVRRSGEGPAARVLANQWLGDQSHIAAAFANGTLVLVEHDRANVDIGAEIRVALDPADLHVFDPESGKAIAHGAELA